MIKIVFKILILLICTSILVVEACPDGIAPCERPLSEEDQQKIINVFNTKRYLFHEVFEISNMGVLKKIGCAYFMEDCSSHLEGDGNVDYHKHYKGACVLGPSGTGYPEEKSESSGSQRSGEKTSYDDLSKEVDNSGGGNIIGWWMIVFFCVFVMRV